MNSEEFYDRICSLPEICENRDLEEFLLALYQKVLRHKEKTLTYDLLLEMITESFTSEVYEFQEKWLEIVKPPNDNIMSEKITNPEISDAIHKTNTTMPGSFEFTLEVLQFQISDLHKMRGKQLEDKFRYLGIDSETGNRWYNFDPFGNLECGARCMVDNDQNLASLDWSFIGELLEMGRIYE